MHDHVFIDVDGEGRLAVVNAPPADASPRVREGFAARHSVATTGTCSWCAAPLMVPNRAARRAAARAGRPVPAPVEHEPWCPAIDPQTLAAVGDNRNHGKPS